MRLADSISLRSRERKLRLFLDELRPTSETSVLDVGADELGFGEGDGCGTLNFFEEHYPWPERITALGLHDGSGFRARYPDIRYVQGDACALPFADGEFDIVFSNAVIEHVGGRERQRRLVSEALRVGRRVFITTPNRRFPIEVHTRLPFVHWLPDAPFAPRLPRARQGVRDRPPSAVAPELRRALPGTRSHRQPRTDAGGDRRLAPAASSGSRPGSSSWGSCCTTSAMAQLWDLGVRGTSLDVVAAWKEALLLVALLVVAWHVRRWPAVKAADVLAASYAVVIVVYWLIPQDVLGGEATTRGELLALRHHLFPVAAYALGRLAALAWEERGRVGGLIALSAVIVAVVGLLDLAFVSLQAWRESGVPGWYREQLGLDYEGLSGLPENWVFNTGDEENPIRRLVSTFLSPLASAYALVVALIYVLSRPFRWWWGLIAVLLYVALLYTHTRAAFAALAFGLVVLAVAQRRIAPAAIAAATVVVGALFLVAYPSIGPSTSYTPEELEWLRENAQQEGGESSDPLAGDDAVDGEPLAQPPRRSPRGHRAPAGVRSRQRRRRREADGGRDPGGRVDVHGARGGRRNRRRRCVRAVEPRSPRRAVAAGGVARRRVRDGARPRVCRPTSSASTGSRSPCGLRPGLRWGSHAHPAGAGEVATVQP